MTPSLKNLTIGLTSTWHWILVLLLLFGTSKLPNVGRDLARTIRSFMADMGEPDGPAAVPPGVPVPRAEDRPA